MKIVTALAAAAFALSAGSALAGPYDPSINHRQARQHERIAHGVESGQLTGRERAHLAAEQRALAARERFYKRDGVLTAHERANLHRGLNFASRDIYWQRHDAQRR